jgi:hypothetical protein
MKQVEKAAACGWAHGLTVNSGLRPMAYPIRLTPYPLGYITLSIGHGPARPVPGRCNTVGPTICASWFSGDTIRSISIKAYSFQLEEPYAAGHQLTAAEAAALNGLRAENICNNVRKFVNDVVLANPPGAILPAETLARIQDRISQYDARYQFKETSRPLPAMGSLESEVRDVASETVQAEVKKAKLTLLDDEWESAIEAAQARPEVQAEARRRLAAKTRVAGSMMKEVQAVGAR